MPQKLVAKRPLGKNGPEVSAIGLGTMGMGAFYGKSDEEECLKTLTYAADRGMTFWDTADIYGTSEDLLGKWFTQTGRRSEIFLATKFGAWDPTKNDRKPNSKPSYIRSEFQRSLTKLNTHYVDLYYQHRVDPEVPIEVVLETLWPFVKSGQIRWIGLSEPSVATLRRAKAVKHAGGAVIAAQMEYSMFELYVEKTGFADAINEYGMAVVAYSPLGRGLITGRFRSPEDFDEGDWRRNALRFSKENFPKNLRIVDEINKFAAKYNTSSSQIALAWILAEHPNFIPIPGARSVERVEENARAAEITLSPDDVLAIRALVEKADVAGERYPPGAIPQGDCIPLSEWKGES
ncbi:putative aldo keto reductase [Lyophyllum shimeji]|uniref:Aldo keto reductase n=1 Tax=Lyophyllum shimeji TaxID=47721 RepID=A0A9P3PZJ5_LYOSH|nr:putative aldo keto reductase [Lyophyllum shimeji]